MRSFIMVLILAIATTLPNISSAQSTTLRNEIQTYIDSIPNDNMNIGRLSVQSLKRISGDRKLRITVRSNFLGMPFRPESLDTIHSGLTKLIQGEYPHYEAEVYVGDYAAKDLIPNFYALEKDSLRQFPKYDNIGNVVTRLDQQDFTKGLTGRNLAIWQSHGLYYKQQEDRWVWQRARLFSTVEDKFVASFVIPYLLPMLENAGANVFLPRERDMQQNEVIVDNNTHDEGFVLVPSEVTRGYDYVNVGYHESGEGFSDGKGSGFAHHRGVYTDYQNPFLEGSYRQIESNKNTESKVEWIPMIPEKGDYSVWVSYKSLPNSIDDALYTVFHSDGKSQFKVNQTMGGGTWIYLGTFHFNEGVDHFAAKVELSSKSAKDGIITIDAVRFGGGMGNVSRRLATESDLEIYKKKVPDSKAKLLSPYSNMEYTVSGVARFWEGARYWLQWAGAPDSVYSTMLGVNDYVDDFSSRGLWVNWLNGGSVYAPDSLGLNIPIDASLAFHTDAGSRLNDIIGTLGIHTSKLNSESKKETFPNGMSRYMSRDFVDIVMTNICDDIEKTCNPKWNRRGMWNKSYAECRQPEVPSMILELLSHQNMEDMRYGLDPRFKFIVSRAIYKAMLEFIHDAYQLGEYQVQPLPISQFSAQLTSKLDSVNLQWAPTVDKLEPSAIPSHYIVYTNLNGGWDNGILAYDTCIKLPIQKDIIYSYKVVAVNDGGKSMDSEMLSVCSRTNSKGNILIVNAFDRIGAPESFQIDSTYAGFSPLLDHGVAHNYDIQYCGEQYEFKTSKQWVSDDNSGWGACHSNHEHRLVVGNTFNYPLLHGKSIFIAGYSFSSTSKKAVENKVVDLNNYAVIDLILGEQKHIDGVDSNYICDNKTFSVLLQDALESYLANGKSLFVSGTYIASGMQSTSQDKDFIRDNLHLYLSTEKASTLGEIVSTFAPNIVFQGKYSYSNVLNSSIYAAENPDAISPADNKSFIFLRYSGNKKGAAIAHSGKNKVVASTVPFETILTQDARNKMMKQILDFFAGKKN